VVVGGGGGDEGASGGTYWWWVVREVAKSHWSRARKHVGVGASVGGLIAG